MAQSIIDLKHPVSVEIGVYAAKGLVCMALGHKANKLGKVIGIDPWLPSASVEGQPEDHAKWWSKLDHDRIFNMAKENVLRYGVSEYVELVRSKSEDAPVPLEIGVLRIDGNHGPRCIIDVRRFAPSVVVGGTLYMDDVNWPQGPLQNGADEDLADMGFKKTLEIGTTYVFKRERK